MSRSMLTRTAVVALVLGLVALAAWHVAAQPQGGMPQGGMPQGFPGGMPPVMGPTGPGPSPMPVVVLGEGMVYVACDGKLTAFNAKTLEKVAEATYWERPKPPWMERGPQ